MNSIVGRVLFAIALLIAVIVYTGMSSIATVSTASQGLQAVNEVNSVKQRYAINFRGSVHDRSILIRDVVLAPDDADRAASIAGIEELRGFYAESATPMAAMFTDEIPDDPIEVDILRRIEEVEARTIPIVERIIGLVDDGEMELAHEVLMSEARPAFIDWLGVINEFIDFQEALNQSVGAEISASVDSFDNRKIVLIGASVVIALAMLAMLLMAVRPLRTLANALEQVADGNLDVVIGKGGVSEVRRLRGAAEKMLGGLHGSLTKSKEMERLSSELGSVFSAVNDGNLDARVSEAYVDAQIDRLKSEVNHLVENIADGLLATRTFVAHLADGDLTYRMTGADQGAFAEVQRDANLAADSLEELIAHLKDTLGRQSNRSRALEEQMGEVSTESSRSAAMLEETVAALEELTQSVRSSSDSASSASSSLSATGAAMDECARMVENTVKSMDAISTASNEISDIISLIDEISYQTNLLALNSGVEAARAGDAGKGFAVVANEVRALAQRSADAAETIKSLISKSSGQVSDGVRLVNDTGQAIFAMRDQLVAVVGQVEEMASATVEQSSNIAVLSSTATELDRSVTRNATTLAKATDDLRDVAQEASGSASIADRFRTEGKSSSTAVHMRVA